jgi:hypothetical protein
MGAKVSTPQQLFSEVVLCSACYPFFHCGGSPQKEAYDPQLTIATPAKWVSQARWGSHTTPASHARLASNASPASHAWRLARPGYKQTRQTSRSRSEPGQVGEPHEAGEPHKTSKQREGVGPRSPILYIWRQTCCGQVPGYPPPADVPGSHSSPE